MIKKILHHLFRRNQKQIKGKGNKILISSRTLFKNNISISGHNNTIKIESKCRLNNCTFTIYGSNNEIIIKENCILNETEFHIEDNNNIIILNECTTIFGKTHFACIEGCEIEIGKDCMFSSDIILRTGDSHSIVNLSNERINPAAGISIGDHVWIGNRVTINKGVKLASNTIIGAGSIVTKTIEKNNTIIAGSPAKIIKEDINWLRERI